MSTIVNDNERIVIEFDGMQLSLDGDNFKCYYFELTNRCNAISTGLVRFFGTELSGGDLSLLSNGHSFIGNSAIVKYYNLPTYEILFEGYVSSVTSSNNGEVTYIEFELSSPEFWMLSGRNIVSFNEPKTHKEILEQIFSQYNPKLGSYSIELGYDVPSGLISTHEYEENDYEYVKRVASETGSLFYSLNGDVIFRPIEPDSYSYIINLDEVDEIKLKSNIVGIPKSVTMSYIKDDDYENPVYITESLPDQIGGGLTADLKTSNIDDSTSFSFFNSDIDSDETSSFLAKVEHKRRSLNFIECEISCDIMPKLKVGSSVKLLKSGSIADNDYILTSFTHKFENTEDGASLTTTLLLNSDSMPSTGGIW